MNEYMKIALKEAKKAYKKQEIPVGTVIVYNNKIIAKAHNNRQRQHNVLGHAEINAIIKASKKLKDWRLDKCEMFVTLCPCEMCKNIIKESRISKVFYLLDKPKNNIQDKNYVKLENKTSDYENYKNEVKQFFENLRK